MSSLIIALALLLQLVRCVENGEAGWAAGTGLLLGLIIGRLLTFAYRRGTILRLERELDGYRVQDEDDD